ncbi:uncharacterized protein N7506_003466 [Penicillium brevicompactum]|uniref:uncharacterized protein n=1 Tax=Penicillium brevicompactum TaxID=5074 RepID=UPI0025411E53|nr:uncharacterized protein N7506_003466 [Penicillium brevicompactum]KAJ5343642.1 hypothetical protein N7506_003466 [Penicillium brevicompactum]
MAETSSVEPIAVIGVASNFSNDAADTEKLWTTLLQGKSQMRPFPADRMNLQAHFHSDPERGGTIKSSGGHFLKEDISRFDAPFFGIPQTEAVLMDPQQRLLLENVYHALENGGITLEQARGSNTSIYVGSFCDDYRSILATDPDQQLKYKITGTYDTILANRVSWFFDFKGNSVVVDTACSSSLVALHMACQNLRLNECDTAIASGVNLICDPRICQDLTKLGALSPDGLSYSFDSRANGYSRGEGLGSIVIKRLSDAVRDGDTVRAVIHASGANHDGRTRGIFAPSSEAQEKLVRDTYRCADLGYKYTSYVEAHGTGTAVGDPTEVRALVSAFKGRPADHPLYIGAVKSVLGHTEGAAGILGVIKTILILESGVIPPNVNLEQLNPAINSTEWNVIFPTSATTWPTKGPRFASVNSFGFGGSNGHIVLGDALHSMEMRNLHAPHRTTRDPPDLNEVNAMVDHASGLPSHPLDLEPNKGNDDPNQGDAEDSGDKNDKPALPFIFSASDEHGIERVTCRLAEHIASLPVASEDLSHADFLNDLSYSLSTRSQFSWRASSSASSIAELIDSISNVQAVKCDSSSPVLGFVFTGQGAQWLGMGLPLHRFAAYRDSLDAASRYLCDALGAEWSAVDLLISRDHSLHLEDPTLAHPLCTILQIAAVDLLRSWNVVPTLVVGHSSGEIPAAYAAGLISRKSAWRIAYYRGVVSKEQESKEGSMMAVKTDEQTLRQYIDSEVPGGSLTIACVNSPSNFTVSGDETALMKLQEVMERDGVMAKHLSVHNAYHSSHMEAVVADYLRLIGNIEDDHETLEYNVPVTMISSVTGRKVDRHFAGTAAYWTTNLAFPVHFAQAIRGMVRSTTQPVNLLEIGPHSVLKSAISETLNQDECSAFSYSSIMTRHSLSSSVLQRAVASLWEKGHPVDLPAFSQSCSLSGSRKPQLSTSIPPYSFDHHMSYWTESRLSRNYRLREQPRKDILGAPVPDWNEDEPKWRHFLRISENPWLMDHVVSGKVIYPAVGHIAMVIEAQNQIASNGKILRGFTLQDLHVSSALIIPDTAAGVEVMLSFVPIMDLSTTASNSRRQFFIRSYNEDRDEWNLHCTGQVSVEYERESTIFDAQREISVETMTSEQLLCEKQRLCRASIDFDKIYQKAEDVGIRFGPLFRNLSEAKIHHGANEVGDFLGTVTIPDIAKSMPHAAVYPHIAHPAMLDSLMHSVYGSVSSFKGKDSDFDMYLPTHIGEVWISSNIRSEPGHEFLCHNATHQESLTTLKSDITLWDKSTSTMQVRFTNVDLTHVDSSHRTLDRSAACHWVDWKQDLESIKQEELLNLDYHSSGRFPSLERLELTATLFIKGILPDLEDCIANNNLPAYFNDYMGWMRQFLDTVESGEHPLITPKALQDQYQTPDSFHSLCEALSATSANGRLCVKMGLNLPRILQREADPLELMFGDDDLMNAVYREVFEAGNLPNHLATYLGYLGHQRNGLRVLEIGAGTGSTTIHILNSLCPLKSGLPWSVEEFVFTDISAGFMEEASRFFEDWQGIMNYTTFDVERNPVQQGLELGSFDLVVAGNVLHATKSLSTTLRNVRSLLKPHGRLILHELVSPQFCFLPFSFGLLPGWWSSKDSFRAMGPLLNETSWNHILRRNGFTGADHVLPDSSDKNAHISSIIVAGAAEERKGQFPLTTTSIIDLCQEQTTGDRSAYISDDLVQSFGIGDSRVVTLAEALQDEVQDTVYVVLADISLSFWEATSEQNFEDIKRILNTANNLLWVSIHDGTPQFAMSAGLLRTARSESLSSDRNLTTLDMNTRTNPQNLFQSTVCDVFYRQFLIRSAQPNEQYRLEGGRLEIARRLQEVLVDHSNGGLKLIAQSMRQLDSLAFVDDQTSLFPLGESHIEVEMKTVGINFMDLLVAMGDIPNSEFGVEGAGVVTQVGTRVENLSVGDRVMVFSDPGESGTLRTFCRTRDSLALKIPDTLSFETASALPALGCTVIYSLRDVARLGKGETVLIHAGSGGTGQTAIQYAQSVGAEVFTTVSSTEKRKLVMDLYGIPEDHVFYSRDATFAKQIKRVTSGRGVDVVLNSLGGELLRHSWSCIAPLGRFIELGKRDIFGNGKLDMKPFTGGSIFAAVDLVEMIKLRPSAIQTLLEDTLQFYLEGIISPPSPITTLKFSEAGQALRRLQTGKSTGKMVLVSSEDDIVLTLPFVPSELKLPADASFVIAGGLGGLGRSVAKWMASIGAQSLIFLSRSGGETPEAQQLIDHLSTVDCTATIVKCDITDFQSLHEAVQSLSQLPPIRGCIQAAMQLKDASLNTMTLNDFNAAVSPKAQGSWNLHSVLPQDLDFFVMLSSVCGIMGNMGQGNYAAGNTYQDELARYRSDLGMPTFSIDLGVVTSAGYVAENLTSKRNLGSHLSAKADGLNEKDIFQALEYCLHPENSPVGRPGAHQIVLGLDTVEILQPRKSDTEVPAYARHALWTHVRGGSKPHHDQESSGAQTGLHQDIKDSTSDKLKQAESFDAATKIVLDAIQAKLSSMLSIPSADVDANQKLSDYGVDSLVAVEFRSWMKKDIGADIPVLDIVGSDSIENICTRVAGLSDFVADQLKR